MSYIILTEAHVLSGLTGPEGVAAKSAALGAGQTGATIIADEIAGVTKMIRGRVAACAKNVLGEDGKIPDECLTAAIDMAVYRLAKRIPGKVLLTAERKDANADALSYLKDVAKCEVAIVPPTTEAPADEQAGGGPAVRLVSSTTRRATRSQLSGL